MEHNNIFYYKIDVRIGHRDGYSFMVTTPDKVDDEDVLERARKAGCFQDDGDIDAASVDTFITEYDIKAFDDCTYAV